MIVLLVLFSIGWLLYLVLLINFRRCSWLLYSRKNIAKVELECTNNQSVVFSLNRFKLEATLCVPFHWFCFSFLHTFDFQHFLLKRLSKVSASTIEAINLKVFDSSLLYLPGASEHTFFRSLRPLWNWPFKLQIVVYTIRFTFKNVVKHLAEFYFACLVSFYSGLGR